MSTTAPSPHSTEWWRERAAALDVRSKLFIDGAFVDAAEGATFASINPATGETIAQIAEGRAEDIDRAVRAARASFERGVWSDAKPRHRKAVLRRLAELILEHREELSLLDTIDMGKPISLTYDGDIPGAASIVEWYAEAIDKIYDEIAPTGVGDLALITREPLGVVGAVVPWNYPLDMAIWKLAPALAAGNSVVLKPAEQSPLSALLLAELAIEAGLPAGVLNVVPGYGETVGAALGLHMDVDVLAFTGSTEVGKYFLKYAGESNMKQVWLECGGKSPNLIFADTEDLDSAAELAAGGIFGNQGEVCSAASRLLVDRSIKDEFVALVASKAADYQPGDPLDPAVQMGALVTEEHTQRVLSYIAKGREVATLVQGGSRLAGPGCFVEPTIFDDVSNDSVIAQEEIFGPVLSVIPFSSEEEAVQIANHTTYGLAASVFTSNLSRALRVARKVRAGTVSVNTVDAGGAIVPFGGFKQSGTGRDLSLHSLDKYTGLKTTWISY